jgi:hypothetical protein
MSPPGGWRSGWPPARNRRSSPRAWSASSGPERSAGAQDPAAHPCPLRHLPRPASGRQAHPVLRRPQCRVRPGRGELRRRLRPDRPRRRHARRPARQRPARPRRFRAGLARDRRTRITALARHDPGTQTITLVLDATTASIAIYAIAAHADEREAHVREVERFGAILPEGSYGRSNRHAIAARETRVAARLRAVEHAYRTAADRDTGFRSPEPARAPRPVERAVDRELELE